MRYNTQWRHGQSRKFQRCLLACAALAAMLLGAGPLRADVFSREDIITDPTWQRFSVCYDNGCASVAEVSLTPAQWDGIRAILQPPPANAAEERERLREAIARMEKYVGGLTGTWADKGGTFNFSSPGQMDCIDESTNTTLYLTMFKRHELLRYHRIEDRSTRGWFIFGWPHTTAVIWEVSSGDLWAVDSWFLDNGEPPYILPLALWRRGWAPED